MDKRAAKSLEEVEEVEDKKSRTFNMEEWEERATWGGRFFLLPLS